MLLLPFLPPARNGGFYRKKPLFILLAGPAVTDPQTFVQETHLRWACRASWSLRFFGQPHALQAFWGYYTIDSAGVLS